MGYNMRILLFFLSLPVLTLQAQTRLPEVANVRGRSLGARSRESDSKSDWRLTPWLELSMRETYDNNIYTTSVGPLSNVSSIITELKPTIGWSIALGDHLQWKAAYQPDFTFYHHQEKESHQRHRWTLAGHQAITESLEMDLKANTTWNRGSDAAPVWTEAGGAPAFGAYETRNRRNQFQVSYDARLTQSLPHQFYLSGRLSGTYTDFQTKRDSTPGLQIYYDRDEHLFGLDAGKKWQQKNSFFLGYRFGAQHQEPSENSGLHYSNTFHRMPLGLNLQPWT